MSDKPVNGNPVQLQVQKPVNKRTLLRELKSFRDSRQSPWEYRVLDDAMRALAEPVGTMEAGWDALAAVNAAKAVAPPVAPDYLLAREAVQTAYNDNQAIEFRALDDPLSGWHDATPSIIQQGWLWETYEYRVKMTECPHGIPHRYPCQQCNDEAAGELVRRDDR